MIPSFPVYLFDVDGTLVDSAADICGAIRAVLSGTTRPDVEEAFLRRYIGFHLNDLFGDLFPERSAAGLEELVVEYRRVYPLRNHSLTTRYAGVKEALAGLGGRLSLVRRGKV